MRFKDPNDKNKIMINKIKSMKGVSLHVRRGDYVGNPRHPLQSVDYYEKALDIILSKIGSTEDLHLFIFSNDIPWVKQNLQFDIPYTIVDIILSKN